MAKKISDKEFANRTAQSLISIAADIDQKGGSDPESNHRNADLIRAEAASLIERARAAK